MELEKTTSQNSEVRYWSITDRAMELIRHTDARFSLDEKARKVSEYQAKIQAASVSGDWSPEDDLISINGTVGVLSISGALFKSEMDAWWYGGTSFEVINKAWDKLQSNSMVRSIMLSIDSPGGEVAGTGEFADRVKQSEKPVVASVEGLACSAAYWIASQASFILMSESSEVGSIGVVATYVDYTGMYEKYGIKLYTFTSTQSPMKRPNLETEEGKAEIKKTIDALAEIFVGKVSLGRNVSREEVLSEFGRGGVIVGMEAVKKKLADGIMTLREALGSLSGGNMEQGTSNTVATAPVVVATPAAPAPAAAAPVVAPVAQQHGETADQAYARGIAEGAKAERERIQSIDALGVDSAHAKLVEDAKYTNVASASDLLLRIHEATKITRAARQEAIRADGALMPQDLRSAQTEGSEAEQVTEGLAQAMREASSVGV